MQFITSGNRIAVENFVLGDLYTITFTNGTYINSACIGIGDNFVTFQRNEPELIFSLTMATAELVSSIELYAGGSGTNNYNDLTNKPQINDVELVGNKSLSDLGIQATISDIDTIRSGAAAGATAVQPAALADYQPIISDLDTIRSGAAAGATAVQPAALAGYQTIIDSSNKLDADLVDDTTATHKFATAAQLSQIETNKNNILSIQTDMGVPTISNTTTLADYAGTLAKGYHTAFIVNGQNPSDSPISDNCFVDFFVYSANTAEMRVYPTYSAYAGEFYVRTKVSGSWGGWFKFQGTAVT